MSSRAASCWRRCGRLGCLAPQTGSGDLRKASGGRASCGKGPGGRRWPPGCLCRLPARRGLCRGHPRLAAVGARVGGSVAREDRRGGFGALARPWQGRSPHEAASCHFHQRFSKAHGPLGPQVSVGQKSGGEGENFAFFFKNLLQEGSFVQKFSGGCHHLPPLHGLVYKQTCPI